jgi:hypothetical protein
VFTVEDIMSLLREIQKDAVNQGIDFPTLLRKCTILATRLKHEAFKRWIDNELNGYKSDNEIPEYRILNVQSYGYFIGPFGGQLENAPIPPICLPKEFRDLAIKANVCESVGNLVTLVNDKKGSTLSSSWPADITARFGQNIYEDMNCLKAWRIIGQGQIAGILDTVRTRVLTFVLEIDSEAPETGEAEPTANTLSTDRVSYLYQTIILGNVGNVSSGGSGITQISTVEVYQNNFESLQRFLSSVGITDQDINELKVAVKTDPLPKTTKNFGKKVSTWIGKMISKAASGLWKVSTTVAADIISKALVNYYGLK